MKGEFEIVIELDRIELRLERSMVVRDWNL